MSHKPHDDWQSLDKDLKRISVLETASFISGRRLVAIGIALVFIVGAGVEAAVFFGLDPKAALVVAAAVFSAYLALNIGANDVSNNMGPAVGAGALPIGVAIAIAAICEAAGALIAGGDVVTTISRELLEPTVAPTPEVFMWAMLSALISSAIWVNIATWIGAPVSTTHAVVGGVLGAGIAAAGFAVVNWPAVTIIMASWVTSPLAGGLVAAVFLALIRRTILDQDDKIAAARRWLPVYFAIMAGSFSAYLMTKGLSKVIDAPSAPRVLAVSFGFAALAYLIANPIIRVKSVGMENRTKSIKRLFRAPLVIAAALLSFAHGANDVANAVGPLAAIVHTYTHGDISLNAEIPLWVMLIGAFGISFGLMTFGPKLIRMVGNQITKLNPVRGFCVALSAAVTVIIASGFGLPVSSTHIAVGAVFGVGFFREWDQAQKQKRSALQPRTAVEERRHRRLVRRSHFMTIIAAWMVTLPITALFSAAAFHILQALG